MVIEEPDPRALPRLVSHLMDEVGMSTLRLSEETGIPRTTLQRRLRTGSGFEVGEVHAIALALGTTASSLLRRAEADSAA